MPQESQRIRDLLRAGLPVPDAEFDALLPDSPRLASARHWTPVKVALRAAQALAEAGAGQVLDVGSGAGKFCVIGALATPLAFTGIEHREHLVREAEALAMRLGVSERATFVASDFDTMDFRDFDALYFFNPFGENQFTSVHHIDATVELNRRRFDRDVAKAERLLDQVSRGTHLATYNGFGGRIPDTFDLLHAQFAESNLLRLWRKSRRESAGGYWLELEGSTLLRGPGDQEQTFFPTLQSLDGN
ncbi:MAG TPA: class I SAM-dependent methyltransferase [Holophagaceae bacterium]|nr:class I SAM-dependent methyltransferase [Holophagaceae bacterium]